MKNKIGSIIASIFLLFVVGALVYMFYIQTARIKDLRGNVETLEMTIETLEGEKAAMVKTMDGLEVDLVGKNDEIDKFKVKIEILNDNSSDITAIRKILEENFDYDEVTEKEDISHVETISFLDMGEDELRIYESFKEEYNDEMLTAVEPFAIMKFYLYSGYMKDYETEYELYEEYVEGGMNWTKEEHMNFPEEDQRQDYGIFEEAYDVEVEMNGDQAVVKWNSDYDNDEDFKYGFRLEKNDNGIWKVGFMPMQ